MDRLSLSMRRLCRRHDTPAHLIAADPAPSPTSVPLSGTEVGLDRGVG